MFKKKGGSMMMDDSPGNGGSSGSGSGSGNINSFNAPSTTTSTTNSGDAARFLSSLQNSDLIERVRTTIPNAHVFKLPPRQSASVGWRGADWKDKVWQGTVKVVERGNLTAVLLVDKAKGSIFAVCPVQDGAVDRCVDSSRYFVLRIENANGRHMYIGVAFNERNHAFDFNTALEDSRREREQERNPVKLDFTPKDYSIKDGQKLKVSIPKQDRVEGAAPPTTSSSTRRTSKPNSGSGSGGMGSFLKPSSRDTDRRHAATTTTDTTNGSAATATATATATAAMTNQFGSTNFFDSPPTPSASSSSGGGGQERRKSKKSKKVKKSSSHR